MMTKQMLLLRVLAGLPPMPRREPMPDIEAEVRAEEYAAETAFRAQYCRPVRDAYPHLFP